MHLFKFLLAAMLFFTANACLAQECPEGIKTIINDDDTASLASVITPENIDACCEEGYTAISHAIRLQATACLEWLLQKKADVNARCGNAKPPIYLACKYGDLKLFKKLIENGADTKAHYGDGLLAYAARYNNEIAEYLKATKK